MTIPLGVSVCGKCGSRSAVYAHLPTCRSCGENVCAACVAPDTANEPEPGVRYACLCKGCASHATDTGLAGVEVSFR